MRYKPIKAEDEGLQNHLERLGYDYKLWRRLVGNDPSDPIAKINRIMREMGLKSRSTVYRWLKLDAKTTDKQR